MFGKIEFVCHYCHESYMLSWLKYHTLKRKYGEVRCPYCRRELSRERDE